MTTEATATNGIATVAKRDTWSQGLVADLVGTFSRDGLDAARKHMSAKHGIPHDRTDAKLAALSLLTLDPDEIKTIDAFIALLRGMEKPNRGIALAKVRSAMKEGAA